MFKSHYNFMSTSAFTSLSLLSLTLLCFCFLLSLICFIWLKGPNRVLPVPAVLAGLPSLHWNAAGETSVAARASLSSSGSEASSDHGPVGAVLWSVLRQKLLHQQHHQGEVVEAPSPVPRTHHQQGQASNMATVSLKFVEIWKRRQFQSCMKAAFLKGGQKKVKVWRKRVIYSSTCSHSLTPSALKGTFFLAKGLQKSSRRALWLT